MSPLPDGGEEAALLPLTILHLDEHLVAIDKPAGMLVHPDASGDGPEWVAMKRVRDLLDQHVYPVHRLDRPTSGVLLFALNASACTKIQQSFAQREVEKVYLAVVEGGAPARWDCDTPLRRGPGENPQPASTSFETLCVRPAGSFPAMPELAISLVKAMPRTGRYHQIRRHLLEAGHPIAGDFRYAGSARALELGEVLGTRTRMLLQAKSLGLPHPVTGEWLTITAPADAGLVSCFPDQAKRENENRR